MPWCPVCKNEFVEGITVCNHCKCDLVETLLENERKLVYEGDGETVTRCQKFLEYNEIESAEVEYNAEEETYYLYVNQEEERSAIRILLVFMDEEEKRIADEKVEASEEAEIKVVPEAHYSGVYQNSTVKANEYRSSAYMLIIVGVLGIVAMIFGYLGYFPFKFSSISYLVMGFMFIFFAVTGILSFGSSKRLMEKADKEEILHKELETWANETFTKEYVETSIEFKENDSEEILYFKRIEKMKKELMKKYPEVDPAYVDEFLDNLYQELYAE